ncbi:flp pilus-assembly TadE/G-like family protein [Corynebacterium mastitidis]
MGRGHRREGRTGEEGYATVVAAVLSAGVVGIAATAMLAAGNTLAHHRAQVAAVAGAHRAWAGGDACAVAGGAARDNQAEMVECRREAADVVVTVALRGRTATARAGPL